MELLLLLVIAFTIATIGMLLIAGLIKTPWLMLVGLGSLMVFLWRSPLSTPPREESVTLEHDQTQTTDPVINPQGLSVEDPTQPILTEPSTTAEPETLLTYRGQAYTCHVPQSAECTPSPTTYPVKYRGRAVQNYGAIAHPEENVVNHTHADNEVDHSIEITSSETATDEVIR
jgi:hypothetical protein